VSIKYLILYRSIRYTYTHPCHLANGLKCFQWTFNPINYMTSRYLFRWLTSHIAFISCFISIRDLRPIRNTLDSTIQLKLMLHISHSFPGRLLQLSLIISLPRFQLDRLQLILNSVAHAISKTLRFFHISPVLKSLHRFKIDQRIHYKIILITYKTLQSFNLHNLLHIHIFFSQSFRYLI